MPPVRFELTEQTRQAVDGYINGREEARRVQRCSARCIKWATVPLPSPPRGERCALILHPCEITQTPFALR